MRWDIGIDLGTDFARLSELKQGATLETAARIALRDGRDTPICCGDVAARIDGRTCQGVKVVSPLADGVLENNFYADRLFRWLYRQSDSLSRIRRFGAMISCAPFARPVQQEAMLVAALDAGASEAALVRADAAAAIGAGLDLNSPEAKLIVDVGAGKITATLFTLGRVAAEGHLPYGLNRIDKRIQNIVRTEAGYRIGLSSAREIKHTLGTALPEAAPEDIIMRMSGFSIEKRQPETFDLETQPVIHACEEVVREIAGLCANVVTEAPEELSADLNDVGITLVGGGAELSGLDKRLGDTLGIPCSIADAPSKAAARGMFIIMQDSEKYPVAIMRKNRRSNVR